MLGLKCRNKESITLGFVTIAFTLISLAFLVNTVVHHFINDDVTRISLTQYGTSIGAVLFIWLGRETVEKVKDYKDNLNKRSTT